LKGAIGSVPVLIYNCQLYFKKYRGIKETVMLNREKYILPKLEDAKKRIIFKKCYDNDFLFFTPTGKISDIDEYTKKQLIEGSEIYEQKVLNCF
jgi:regulatory protein YycI of two-component signal transduction system YycFG